MKSEKDLDIHCQTKDTIMYSAPISGYYSIASQIIVFEPTGNMIETENSKWRWYKFWLPKTVMVPETRQSYSWEGREVKFLKEGDIVVGPVYRLGN